MNTYYYKERLYKKLASKLIRSASPFPSNDFFSTLKEKNHLKLFQVFGVPRSGTTLLASIIDHHTNAICLIEPLLSLQSQGVICIDKKYQIKKREKYSLRDIYSSLSKIKNIQLLGFKETYRTEFHHFYPSKSLIESNISSKVFDYQIAIIRDPRDGWASVVKRDPHFIKNKTAFKEYLYSWNSLCNLILFRDDIFKIRYEDLVLDSEKTISQLFFYLNIPKPGNLFPINSTDGFGDKTAQKGGYFFRSSINHYNKYLSKDEVLYIEKKCLPFLSTFKY